MKSKLKPRKVPVSAVALSYEQRIMAAPRISATGRAKIAEEIRRIALRYGVPLVYDRHLVSQLEQLKYDQDLPPELYDEVAHLFVSLGLNPDNQK